MIFLSRFPLFSQRTSDLPASAPMRAQYCFYLSSCRLVNRWGRRKVYYHGKRPGSDCRAGSYRACIHSWWIRHPSPAFQLCRIVSSSSWLYLARCSSWLFIFTHILSRSSSFFTRLSGPSSRIHYQSLSGWSFFLSYPHLYHRLISEASTSGARCVPALHVSVVFIYIDSRLIKLIYSICVIERQVLVGSMRNPISGLAATGVPPALMLADQVVNLSNIVTTGFQELPIQIKDMILSNFEVWSIRWIQEYS